MSGAALAAAAESLVGTRFRLHGRDPDTGLDCVGLLAASLAAKEAATAPPAKRTRKPIVSYAAELAAAEAVRLAERKAQSAARILLESQSFQVARYREDPGTVEGRRGDAMALFNVQI